MKSKLFELEMDAMERLDIAALVRLLRIEELPPERPAPKEPEPEDECQS